jgi:phosphoribosyl 1,2-cyclic phosphodiesterase
VHLFISHTHWDHIQGFPFFVPAYLCTSVLHVYGAPGQGRSLERVLRGQMDADYFPVALGDLAATLHVHEFRGEPWTVGEARVAAFYLNHPGMNLGYRVTWNGRSLVYATDHEPYRDTLDRVGGRAQAGRQFGARLDEAFVAFVAGADLYIGEAQYTDEEYPAKAGWGHASLSATVDVALRARVGALALFHHDPMRGDEAVGDMVARAQARISAAGGTLRCFAAAEGQVLEV